MRKTNKASLAKIIEKYAPCENALTNASFVIDGGHLLHRVVWPRPATLNEVIETIVSYFCRHYGADCTVVFNGYCHIPSTKNMRRKQKAVSADIIFDNTMHVSASQSKFLGNDSNKTRFIDALKVTTVSKRYTSNCSGGWC